MIVRAGYEDLLNTMIPEQAWKFGQHSYIDHKVQYMEDTYALSNNHFCSQDIVTDGEFLYVIYEKKLVDGAKNPLDINTVVHLYSFFSYETKVDFKDHTLLWRLGSNFSDKPINIL